MPDRIQRRRTTRAHYRAALCRFHPATLAVSYYFRPAGAEHWHTVSRAVRGWVNALGEFRLDGPLLPQAEGDLAGLKLERIA